MSEFQLVTGSHNNKNTFSIMEVFTGGGKNSYLYGAAYRMHLIAKNIPMKFMELYKRSIVNNGYVGEQVPQEKRVYRFYKV